MFKTITKARNKKTIMVYYALSVISISIGMFTGRSIWYILAVTLLGLALFRKNFNAVEEVGGVPYIMFRSDSTGMARGSRIYKRMFNLFKYNREVFLEHYHKRSNSESVFSMIKRKFGTHLYCKSQTGQINEILCFSISP